jgi:hypothetical protein
MKTQKIFAIISLALILLGVNAVYSKTNSNSDKLQSAGCIKYQVNVHPTIHLGLPLPRVYVIMTDENNNLVAPAQLFKIGVWTYTFTEVRPPNDIKSGEEAGTVTGVRIARMELEGGMIYKEYPTPDVKAGKFFPGSTYQFNLYPADEVKTSGTGGK